MADEQPSSHSKTVREQLEEGAMDLWTSVKRVTLSPREGCSVDQDELHRMSLESVVKVMFGSCTSAANPGMEDTTPTLNTLSPRKSQSNTKSQDPAVDPDSLYRSLFSDNHLRAEEAVAHLREQLDQQRKAAKAASKGVPGVFLVSTPPRKAGEPPPTSDATDTSALQSTSFDDGISIITQCTLDLIAMDHDEVDIHRVHSDVTQDPMDGEGVEESWMETVNPRLDSCSPLRMGRSSSRSHCTVHTKRSQGTKGTKSTESTQTNEFANVWQREEQKYWEEMVKEEDGGFAVDDAVLSGRQKKFFRARELSRKARLLSSNRSSAELSKLSKRDGTITTVHSTVNSSVEDQHRFLDVYIVPPGAEIGEI